MSRIAADLPEDPVELRRFAAALASEVHAKTLLIEKLKMQLAILRRARFGRSSEKLDRDIEQLELLIGDMEESDAERQEAQRLARSETAEDCASTSTLKKQPSVRAPLPDHLPLETIVHDAPCVCPACGGAKFSRVGADERDVLEYVPSHFKRVRHVRPKMSCRACETIVQAPMPTLPIERGRPGPALLAHVLVSKYCDCLPLYRQSDIYAREGVEIDRSVMAGWVGHMAALLEPLSERIARHVRAGAAIHADDTSVPVLDPGRGRTKTGRLWTAVRDERPYGSTAPPAAFYLYAPDRKAERAHALLKGCRGYLHADGYAGFGGLYEADPRTGAPAPLKEVACWAHARRKFYDVHVETKSPAAARALDMIARLFAIEADIKGKAAAERAAARCERANPILDELRAFLETTLAKISGKSDFAKAIRYATSRWTALTRYVDDGRLEMSNNAAERAIRPLALGRKNYLFAGSDDGGRRAAIIYSLIETARLNDIDPEAWLADVIARIADHPISKLDELLPWKWEKQTPKTSAA
jgi:transposase